MSANVTRSGLEDDDSKNVAWYGGDPREYKDTLPEFVLFRSIGNDLPPRHEVGQSYRNVKFILENEENLPGLDKYWLLNRIVNSTEERKIMQLLDSYGQSYLRDPFVLQDYARRDFRWEDYPLTDIIRNREYLGWKEKKREELLDHLYHAKNSYTMHNNEARNVMLNHGIRLGARWILPFDGNCFLTRPAWLNISNTVRQQGGASKYFYVPMERLMESNDVLFDPNFVPKLNEEPQLIFRSDASERFNPNMRYGRRSKVEMLWRLQVAGPWDTWGQGHPWETSLVTWTPSKDVKSKVLPAGWVARLFSGRASLEDHLINRGLSRVQAVRQLLDACDVAVTQQLFGFGSDVPLLWAPQGLNSDVQLCTTNDLASLEYCRAIAGIGEAAKDLAASEMTSFERVALLTLSYVLTNQTDHGRTAADIARQWLQGGTQQARYKQTIDRHGLLYFLDSLRLLRSGKLLGSSEYSDLQLWFTSFLSGELLGEGNVKRLPREARDSTGRGLAYDMRVAATAAFSGDITQWLHTMQRSKLRLLAHYDSKGRPSGLAISDKGPLHVLQDWMVMARMGETSGINLFEFKRGKDTVPLLKAAVEHALQTLPTNDMDTAREVYHTARYGYGDLAVPKAVAEVMGSRLSPGHTPLALLWPAGLLFRHAEAANQ